MRKYIYSWRKTDGKDSTTQYDGAKQYDGQSSAHLLWEDILGPALLWVEPKTDWTKDDFYNFEDLDAVEINTEFIAALLSDLGVTVNLSTVKNRTMYSFEYFDSLNRIESNIKTLADNFYVPTGWITPKTNWQSGHRFDYRDANRLEKNLLLLYTLLMNVFESLKYCGTFTCGEEDVI